MMAITYQNTSDNGALSATSGLLGTAQRAFTQVGTASKDFANYIATETQRAIQNEQNERDFAEKVREFNSTQDLAERKFNEDVRQFGLTYALDNKYKNSLIDNAAERLKIDQAQADRTAKEYARAEQQRAQEEQAVRDLSRLAQERATFKSDLAKFNERKLSMSEDDETSQRQLLAQRLKDNPYLADTALGMYQRYASQYADKTGRILKPVSDVLTGSTLTEANTEIANLDDQIKQTQLLKEYARNGYRDDLSKEINRFIDTGLMEREDALNLENILKNTNDVAKKDIISYMRSVTKEQKDGLSALWQKVSGGADRLNSKHFLEILGQSVDLSEMGGVSLRGSSRVIPEYDQFLGLNGKQSGTTDSGTKRQIKTPSLGPDKATASEESLRDAAKKAKESISEEVASMPASAVSKRIGSYDDKKISNAMTSLGYTGAYKDLSTGDQKRLLDTLDNASKLDTRSTLLKETALNDILDEATPITDTVYGSESVVSDVSSFMEKVEKAAQSGTAGITDADLKDLMSIVSSHKRYLGLGKGYTQNTNRTALRELLLQKPELANKLRKLIKQ